MIKFDARRAVFDILRIITDKKCIYSNYDCLSESEYGAQMVLCWVEPTNSAFAFYTLYATATYNPFKIVLLAKILERGTTLVYPYSRNESGALMKRFVSFSSCFWNEI